MHPLLTEVIDAHGGLQRWHAHTAVQADITTGGGFWAMKGLVQDARTRQMQVALHRQAASVRPFGNPDWRTNYTPQRVAIETTDGRTVQERLAPRAAFDGHGMRTPWDPLHRAYFNGYALWTYLTTPFLLALPGVEVTDIAPWHEGGETWRALHARFPASIASHGAEQTFYFGPDGLLRRHDYRVEVAGGFPAAQYVHDIVEVDGLRFPSRRRAYFRGTDLQPVRDLLLVSIDLGGFRLEPAGAR
ncbi:hypothetical protein ACPOLB_24545 [Rubrivivax sp. RP6-9]|uniref:hypothetical protein n=1 Tax=Rubrivivax sp. RP6-9 TaxID=3415750 RepID=UPI003CC6D922